MSNILGIDPGLSGALAFMNDRGDVLVFDMPVLEYVTSTNKKRREIDIGRLRDIISGVPVSHCCMEMLAGMPRMGGTQMFAMGQGYGMIKAVLNMLGIEYTLVSPQKWKNHYQIPKDKDAARDKASAIFPDAASRWVLKKHDGRAEAALIANYGLEQSGLFRNQNKGKSDE